MQTRAIAIVSAMALSACVVDDELMEEESKTLTGELERSGEEVNELVTCMPTGPVHPGFPSVEFDALDATAGAYGFVRLWHRASDGGAMADVITADISPDGRCAHAALRWLHNNGNYYYDYGMWVCGNGQDRCFHKGARNWTLYQRVDFQVWVDGGPIATFEGIQAW